MSLQPDLSPRGWNGGPMKYGASMGRPIEAARQDYLARAHKYDVLAQSSALDVVKVALRRIRLNHGGYDAGGAYWGHGTPLYWAGSDTGVVDLWFRASDREAAKAHVREAFPNATFYR